jgi:hypothetical protein
VFQLTAQSVPQTSSQNASGGATLSDEMKKAMKDGDYQVDFAFVTIVVALDYDYYYYGCCCCC